MAIRISMPAVVLTVLCLATPAPADDILAEDRLASQLVRNALQLVQGRGLTPEPLTVEAIEVATALMREAADLSPGDVAIWRMTAEMAAMAEDSDLRRRSLERVVELDPDDDAARLKLTTLELDRHQTVETRVAALQRLIRNDRGLTDAARSRLALDLALLERRRGNSEAFGEWLAEAVALDSTNRAAAAMAAGYYQAQIDDPFGEAELLLAVFLANPVDITGQVALAEHMLDHGAYNAAERIYSLAEASYQATGAIMPPALLADFAIARWGRGDADAALRTIRLRQQMANEALRLRLRRDEPDLGPIERARRSAPIAPILTTVRAAVQHRAGDAADLNRALEQAVESYESVITGMIDAAEAEDGRQPDHAQLARMNLELAWVLLWLGGDPDRAEQAFRDAVEYGGELAPAAAGRFDGWFALRRGQYDEAFEHLDEWAETDLAARLGRAVIQIDRGQRRDAARDLLAIAREQPGTLMGVWSADRLAEMLGRRAPISESARRLDDLMGTVPRVIDRLAANPRQAVSIRLTPRRSTHSPYEPILLNLEVTNHSPIPLAIDRAGPIRPEVAIEPSVQIARLGRFGRTEPTVVMINHRLRLEPRERLVIPIDLRHTSVGRMLDATPLAGAMLRAKATINFQVNPRGRIQTGLLGSDTETTAFRVDGVRVSLDRVESLISSAVDAGSGADLARLAVLAHIATIELDDGAGDRTIQLLRDASDTVAEIFPGIPGAAQAWLLSVVPPREAVRPIIEVAHRSEERLVQLIYLIRWLRSPEDPMIDRARRSGDPTLEMLGTRMSDVFDRMRRMQQEEEELIEEHSPPAQSVLPGQ